MTPTDVEARLAENPPSLFDIGHTEVVKIPGIGAAGEHASVRVCARSIKRCVVFDPFYTGEPDVKDPDDWKGGFGRVKICMGAKTTPDYCAR